MSVIEIKVPSPGESISEVQIANWVVKSGDFVQNGQVIAEIDSDKATLEMTAEASGEITILAAAGDTVAVGATAATIDTSKQGNAPAPAAAPKAEAAPVAAPTPAPAATRSSRGLQPASVPASATAPIESRTFFIGVSCVH